MAVVFNLSTTNTMPRLNLTTIASLQIGDEICWGDCHIVPDFKFSRVKNIPPSGQIIAQTGDRFNQNGLLIGTGSKYNKVYLVDPQDARDSIEAYKKRTLLWEKRNELEKRLETLLKKATLSQLEKLEQFLNQL